MRSKPVPRRHNREVTASLDSIAETHILTSMCGRYRIKDTDRITDYLRMTHNIPDWVVDQRVSRYNIAPSQDCPVIIMDEEADLLPVQMMRWGFVPFWETTVTPKFQPINAQAEKVTTGMFKQSVQKNSAASCRPMGSTSGCDWTRRPSSRSTSILRASGHPFRTRLEIMTEFGPVNYQS